VNAQSPTQTFLLRKQGLPNIALVTEMGLAFVMETGAFGIRLEHLEKLIELKSFFVSFSGGGMFFRATVRGSTRWYIQGLVSYGVPEEGSKKCASTHYAVFTR